jgi:hypothetical protein
LDGTAVNAESPIAPSDVPSAMSIPELPPLQADNNKIINKAEHRRMLALLKSERERHIE